MKAFTTKPVAVAKVIDFELDGTHYSFNPPKTSTQLVAMMQVRGKDTAADLQRAGAMFAWLGHGLNSTHEPIRGKQEGHEEFVKDCQACHLQARLEDPSEPLEVETVMEIISWLMGEVTSRPTT